MEASEACAVAVEEVAPATRLSSVAEPPPLVAVVGSSSIRGQIGHWRFPVHLVASQDPALAAAGTAVPVRREAHSKSRAVRQEAAS